MTDTDAHTTDQAQNRQHATPRLDSFRIGETLVLFDDDDRWIRSDAAVDRGEGR